MAEMLDPYLDIPFNGWLGIILILVYACLLRSRGLLLSAVLGVTGTILVCDNASTAGELAKILCELPLGLGSVLAFQLADRATKIQYLPAFTTYVNIAVYGNIGMMVGTPADGTLRGMCSKVACLALFVWVVQQGRRAGWKTVLLHKDVFVFTAVSKPWIFAHAVYRSVLVTLPCFGSGRRHRLLECYSLAMTFALSRTLRLPFAYCFGMADTLVVPATAGWSALAKTFEWIPRDANAARDRLLVLRAGGVGGVADVYLGAVALAVAVFACFQIAKGMRGGSLVG